MEVLAKLPERPNGRSCRRHCFPGSQRFGGGHRIDDRLGRIRLQAQACRRGLVVSWESLERRKNEYTSWSRKKFPANSKEIAIARSYGDLRENHEYKAAKEMQKLLMRRKSELETQLVRARGTDFANANAPTSSDRHDCSARSIWRPTSPSNSPFSARGIPIRTKALSVIFHRMAQSLLNRKAGEEVEFEIHGVHHRHRIESIEAYKLASTAPPPSAPPAPEAVHSETASRIGSSSPRFEVEADNGPGVGPKASDPQSLIR